ncbi:MAG: S41 family peptidase [Aggregatilineales bacterium]
MPRLGRLVIFVSGLVGALFSAAAAYLLAGPAPLLVAPAALIGAVVYGGLWRQQRRISGRGKRRRARWLAFGLLALPLLLSAAFAGGTVYALYNAGQILVPADDRIANFERLWIALRDNYPYFDIKNVDWDAVGARYRPRAAAASTDQEYHALAAEMLYELRDGHTFLAQPHPVETWRFGVLADVDGQAVIAALDDVARAAGLARGDIVTAVNGWRVDEAIAALHLSLRVASTPWSERAWGLHNLLVAWDDARELSVAVVSADGAARTVALVVPSQIAQTGEQGPIVTGRRLPSNIGLIRIPTFGGGEALVAEFDAALDALMDAPALILDVRGNGGGSSLTAAAMAGRLLAEPFEYARECYRQRLPARLWLACSTRQVHPRGPRYDGPAAVLIDAKTGSSAEEFALMLIESGRAVAVGRTSGGTAGNPLAFPLTGGGSVRFSSGDLRLLDGRRLEGQGIAPAVPVRWTLDDWRAGADPDIAAAERLLTGG